MTFSVSPVVAGTVVPQALVQFRCEHPAASVRIMEGETNMMLPLVRDETLDFSVGQKPREVLPREITFRPLFRTQFVVAARQGHPLAGAKSLRDLATVSWFVFSPLAEPAFVATGLPAPLSPVRCESFTALLSSLATTDAVGLIMTHVLAHPIARGTLQRIPVRETLPTIKVGMLTRAHSPLTPVATAMSKAVTEVTRRLATRQAID